MILNCKNCNNIITLDKKEINLEGQLISCENCKEEWIFQSRTVSLEDKLFELDKDLNQKELIINEQNDKHGEKIELLEKSLLIKKKELEKQILLEEKISAFEKRITDTEKLNSHQADLESQIAKIEKELQKTSESILNKNESIEKKTNYLEMKINPYKQANKSKVQKAVNDNENGVVNFSSYEQEEKKVKKQTKGGFFWSKTSDK